MKQIDTKEDPKGREVAGGLGQRFAEAIAKKDSPALVGVLDPDVDFKALTPSRFWEADSAHTLADDVIFGTWFKPSDHIDALEAVEVSSVADRQRVSYRLRITNPDGEFLVEQQAYFSVEGVSINWLRILCSGYRPVERTQTDN